MKKIIGGLRYDTETAIEIGGFEYGYDPIGNFSHWWAVLYKTPLSGRYFLYGKGGARTQFATSLPDGARCSGSDIIPLCAEEALKWAEEYLDPDQVEEHFLDMIKDA